MDDDAYRPLWEAATRLGDDDAEEEVAAEQQSKEVVLHVIGSGGEQRSGLGFEDMLQKVQGALLCPNYRRLESSEDWHAVLDDPVAWEAYEARELFHEQAWMGALEDWEAMADVRHKGHVLSIVASFCREPTKRLNDLWIFVHQEPVAALPDELLAALIALVPESSAIIWKLCEDETCRERLVRLGAAGALGAVLQRTEAYNAVGCAVFLSMVSPAALHELNASGTVAKGLARVASVVGDGRTRRVALVGTWFALRQSGRARARFVTDGGLGHLARVVENTQRNEEALVAAAVVEVVGTSVCKVKSAPGAACVVRALTSNVVAVMTTPTLVDAALSAALSALHLCGRDLEAWAVESQRIDVNVIIAKVAEDQDAFGHVLDRALSGAAVLASVGCMVKADIALTFLESRERSPAARMACGHIIFQCAAHGADQGVLLRSLESLASLVVETSLPKQTRATLAPALAQLATKRHWGDAQWSASHLAGIAMLYKKAASSHAAMLPHAQLALVRALGLFHERDIVHVDDDTIAAVAQVLVRSAPSSKTIPALSLWRLSNLFPRRMADAVLDGRLDAAVLDVCMRRARHVEPLLTRPRTLIVDLLWRANNAKKVCLACVLPLERFVVAETTDPVLRAASSWLLFRLVVESPEHLRALRHRRPERGMIDVLVLGLDANAGAALFALERLASREQDRFAVAAKASQRLASFVDATNEFCDAALRVVLNASTDVRAGLPVGTHILDRLLVLARSSHMARCVLANISRNNDCRSMLYVRLLDRETKKSTSKDRLRLQAALKKSVHSLWTSPKPPSDPWRPAFQSCKLHRGVLRAVVEPGGAPRNKFHLHCDRGANRTPRSADETQFCVFKRVQGSIVGDLLPTYVFRRDTKAPSTRDFSFDNETFHCYFATRLPAEKCAPADRWPLLTLPDEATSLEDADDGAALSSDYFEMPTSAIDPFELAMPAPPRAPRLHSAARIEDPPPVVLVRPRQLPPALLDPPQESAWASRPEGLFENAKLGRRMLARDWHILERRSRFCATLLPKLCGGKNGMGSEKVKSVVFGTLQSVYPRLVTALEAYAARDSTSDSIMTHAAFSLFCKDAQLGDVDPPFQPDRASMLESILRLVEAKYGMASSIANKKEAGLRGPLDKLKKEHLVGLLPEDDDDAWRRDVLYTDSVDDSLRPFLPALRGVWSALGMRQGFGMNEWLQFVEAAGVLPSELDKAQCKLCYFRGRLRVVDDKARCLSFASFLEAVVRVVDCVVLPATRCLRALNADSLADFYDKVGRRNTFEVVDDDTMELNDKLDVVLLYMIHCLAVPCKDGVYQPQRYKHAAKNKTLVAAVPLADYLTHDQRERWLNQPTPPRIRRRRLLSGGGGGVPLPVAGSRRASASSAASSSILSASSSC